MKKSVPLCIIAACSIMLFINAKVIAQKNYVSIETGYFFGNPSNKIASQMKNNGFGDREYNYFFGAVFIHEYPTSTNIPSWLRLRYGRELKPNKTVEISIALVHNSEVTGYNDDTAINERYINFKSKVITLSGTYMLQNKKKTAGFGAGPVLAFYKLNISNRTPFDDYSYSINKLYLQPGITLTGFWRFVNKPVYFMDLRTDFTILSPAKTSAVSNKEDGVFFPSFKVNTFCGDIAISAGIKL